MPVAEWAPVAWVETHSLTFSARHESEHPRRPPRCSTAWRCSATSSSELSEQTPTRSRWSSIRAPLALASPTRGCRSPAALAAPAARRYFAGWFTEHEIHVLAPPALESGRQRARLARGAAAHAAARVRAPGHGRQQPRPPAPVLAVAPSAATCAGPGCARAPRPGSSGQTPLLRAAIVRRLREGGRPGVPARAARRDAARRHGVRAAGASAGVRAAAALATSAAGARAALGCSSRRSAASCVGVGEPTGATLARAGAC